MPSDPAEPLIKDILDEVCISQAAWILEDAVFGKTFKPTRENPEDPTSKLVHILETSRMPPHAREYHIKCQKAERHYIWALLGLVMLSVIEVPSWCHCHEAKWHFIPGDQRCYVTIDTMIGNTTRADHAVTFLSGIHYVPTGYGVLVELTCMAVVLRKFLMQWEREIRFFRSKGHEYGDTREIWIGIVITCLGFVDCAVFFFCRNHFRAVLITRSGLLLMLPSVRNLARVAIAVIWEVCSIMVFLFGAILMFAWVAVTLFHDFKNRNMEGAEINEGFSTFREAVYSMFLASVTEEGFIEHFMTTFVAFRVTGFLWLFFLVLVHLLLLNLVLDTLVAGYMRVTEERMKESASNQAEGVIHSFEEAVQGEETLSKQGFMVLLAELGRSPYLRKVTPNIAAKFFEEVDEDHSGCIDREEFIEICKVMNYEFWITRYDSNFKDQYPCLWNSRAHKWFREFYEREAGNPWRSWCANFDSLMNYVLVINFGMIILESYYDLQDWDEPPALGTLELWFSLIYISELLLKLSVISWGEFWSHGSNQFDFWSTFILCANSAIENSPTLDFMLHVDSRYANMLRVLRLLRVLKTLKRLEEVKFLTATIMRIVQLSREIMTLMSVIIFIFSQISVQMFGGLLYIGNPDLEGTEYKEKEWYVFNYNDVPMAFATWFLSLLVEFTPVLAEVLAKVSPIKYEWLIILFYYLTAVAVVFELVQAFTIEAFVSLYARKHEPKVPLFSGWDNIEQDFKSIGYRIHHNAIGSRGELFEEALEQAFEELFKLDEEQEEKENQVLRRQSNVTNGFYESEGEELKHDEAGNGKRLPDRCSVTRRGSRARKESGDSVAKTDSCRSVGLRKSIMDYAHIGHLSDEEVAHLEQISEMRRMNRRRGSPDEYNPGVPTPPHTW